MTPETRKTVQTPVGQICIHVSAGERSQPTALLWPSLFTDGHANWALQLDPLQALGFRTIVVDPPGHGRSGPPPASFSIRQCSQAALQILDGEAVAQAAFLGVSWGSMVAMKTAVLAPDRITALVLSNTSATRGSTKERLTAAMSCRLIRVGLPGGVGRLVVSGLLGARFREQDPAFTAQLAADINSLDRSSLARAARSVLVHREDLTDGLDRIGVPTLVVAGACDTALPPQHGERVAAAIPGARYECLAGVGHVAPREDGPAFAALLQSFFVGVRTPSPVASAEQA